MLAGRARCTTPYQRDFSIATSSLASLVFFFFLFLFRARCFPLLGAGVVDARTCRMSATLQRIQRRGEFTTLGTCTATRHHSSAPSSPLLRPLWDSDLQSKKTKKHNECTTSYLNHPEIHHKHPEIHQELPTHSAYLRTRSRGLGSLGRGLRRLAVRHVPPT